MIGRLKGQLIHKIPPDIMVDVNGVGYELAVSMQCLYQLPHEGQTVTLYTHLIIREDAHTLYGFADLNERALFKRLLKVNGVGPKSALAILSSSSVSHFQQCIELEDVASLTKIPGIGKKTAERLVLEMREGIATLALSKDAPSSPRSDAISALVSLGYKPVDASKVINRLDDPDKTSEMMIREALREL